MNRKIMFTFSNFSLWETTQTLFWASFGLIDLDNFELAGIKEFTRFWGLCMFGSFSGRDVNKPSQSLYSTHPSVTIFADKCLLTVFRRPVSIAS